jgi:hypothetical protein
MVYQAPQTYAPSQTGSGDQLYQNTLAGYQNALSGLAQRQAGVQQGYSDLFDQQAGYGQSQRQGLYNQYQQNLGQAQQSLVGRGLTGTSAFDSAMGNVRNEYGMQNLALQDQLLGRQNSIRQAGLQYQDNANQQYTGLQGSMLGYQGGYGNQQNAAYSNYLAGQNADAWQRGQMDRQTSNQQLLAQQQRNMGMGGMGLGSPLGGARLGFAMQPGGYGGGGYSPFGGGLFSQFSTGV